MLEFKIECNNLGIIRFRANITDDLKDNVMIKRVLFDSKYIVSNKKYPYLIPIKYFFPLIKNLSKDLIKIDKESIRCFFEFSDEYEEQFFYAIKANAKYMKKWREEGCPKIFKVTLTSDFEIKKDIAFEKVW
ncbi:MAG: hypothetical protein ACRC57_08660 [Sarcina sp.]